MWCIPGCWQQWFVGQFGQMIKKAKYLLTVGTMFPLKTYASGGDILEWIYIQFFIMIAFVITLVFTKLNWTGKGIMIFVFIVTVYLTMELMDKVPYSENRLTINLVTIIAPIVTTFASYWTMKSKFKLEK